MANASRPSPPNSTKSTAVQRNITVHDNDVLSGRGVNIAQHPGNQRFRTLITTFRDQEYCTTYSAGEKRAVALQIIKHIKELDPPGRFLKRDGRGQGSRGLNGPWDELSEREAIKKTCQALRDCNRQDRQGYAKGVVAPGDVIKVVQEVSHIPAKERAAAAAHAIATEATTNALNAISVAANTNPSSIARASDTVNDASSTVSTSSNKRSRDEVNSVSEMMENSNGAGGGNFSSPSSSYYSAQQYHQPDPRFPQGSAATSSVMAGSNYHMPAPQAGLHYQQQHNPYTSLQQQAHHHHHQPSQFQVNIAPYGNAPGSHPAFPAPGANVGASYYPTGSTSASDYLMPMAAAQAPTPYQDVLLSAAMSSATGNGNQPHQHHQQLLNGNFFQNSDLFNSNINASHLPISSSVINHDQQVIKKQRTDDTDPSTGPSEPSPINATNIGPSIKEENESINDGNNGNGNNGSSTGENVGNDRNSQKDASVPSPAPTNCGDDHNDESDSINIEPEQGSHVNGADASELFHHVDGRNIVNSTGENGGRGGTGDSSNNEVSSWVTGPNPPPLESTDQFHDALSGF